MLCYRDMTFCNAPCRNISCRRKFTDAHRRDAAAWWDGCKGEPPVSISDQRDGCPDYIPEEP